MKKQFEAILSNNKTRTVLTVAVVSFIVIVCIGIGSAMAASNDTKASDDKVIAQSGEVKESEQNKIKDVNTNKTSNTEATGGSNTGSGDDSNKSTDNTGTSEANNSGNSNSNNNNGLIGESKAKSIATKKTGGGEIVYCYLDYDDGRAEYDVEIIKGDYEYEMEIDAKTGKVYDFEKERLERYDDDDHDDDYYDYDD